MTKVDKIAEKLRREPYHVFPMRYNCIGKSFRFKRECQRIGVDTRVVICAGRVKARPLGFWMKILMIHAWGEVEGRRIETAHPLGEMGLWGMIDIDLKPIIAIWI